MSPFRSLCSQTQAANTRSRATSGTCADGPPVLESGGLNFMGKVPFAIMPPSVVGLPTPTIQTPTTPVDAGVVPLAHGLAACLSAELMPPPKTIPDKPFNFMDAISLSQWIVQTDPSPNDKGGPVGLTATTKDSDTTDDIESDGEDEVVAEEEVDEVEDDDVLIMDGPGPATGQSGPPATDLPTVEQLMHKQALLKRHIEKLKKAVTMLRGDLAEARRVNNEQNDRLHKIDVHMAHIVDNYPNINL